MAAGSRESHVDVSSAPWHHGAAEIRHADVSPGYVAGEASREPGTTEYDSVDGRSRGSDAEVRREYSPMEAHHAPSSSGAEAAISSENSEYSK